MILLKSVISRVVHRFKSARSGSVEGVGDHEIIIGTASLKGNRSLNAVREKEFDAP